MTHQSKRGYAKSQHEKAGRNSEAADRAASLEEEVQRRVAIELWKLARLEEEATR
jgi:hypothetical protein